MFETGDKLQVTVKHSPEAENDFVVLRYTPTDLAACRQRLGG